MLISLRAILDMKHPITAQISQLQLTPVGIVLTSAYVVRGYFWDVLTSIPGLIPTLEGSEPSGSRDCAP